MLVLNLGGAHSQLSSWRRSEGLCCCCCCCCCPPPLLPSSPLFAEPRGVRSSNIHTFVFFKERYTRFRSRLRSNWTQSSWVVGCSPCSSLLGPRRRKLWRNPASSHSLLISCCALFTSKWLAFSWRNSMNGGSHYWMFLSGEKRGFIWEFNSLLSKMSKVRTRGRASTRLSSWRLRPAISWYEPVDQLMWKCSLQEALCGTSAVSIRVLSEIFSRFAEFCIVLSGRVLSAFLVWVWFWTFVKSEMLCFLKALDAQTVYCKSATWSCLWGVGVCVAFVRDKWAFFYLYFTAQTIFYLFDALENEKLYARILRVQRSASW